MVLMLVGCAERVSQEDSTRSSDLQKPRVVVTTDPELDDSNSLVRYLLYSTDFRTEGLIYASSGYHWKGDGQGTTWFVEGREYTRFGLNLCPCESWRWAEGERFIHDAVETYEHVYPNLSVHHSEYPSPATVKAKIRVGNVAFDGDISEDSPGSDLIKSLLLDGDEDPIYLLAWGGQSTIARALKSIQDQYEETAQWSIIRDEVSRKAIIQSFGDQDDTYARYIKPNWPNIAYRDRANSTYSYGARGAVLPDDHIYLTAAWTQEQVSRQGPLGAFYRVWGDGKQMVKDDIFDYFGYAGLTDDELRAKGYVVWLPVQEQGSWISEGDTPTFMNLLANGLRGYEDATYGGWGGRSGTDVGPQGADPNYALSRFFGAAQRDFAARMKWSVTSSFGDANHEPKVHIEGPLHVAARPGETIRFQGSVTDPDGDTIVVKWWQYEEADTYPGQVTFTDATAPDTHVRVPQDAASGDTIHLILEATDNGTPSLTRYQRIIVSVSN